jgi:lambda family phage tail tape measure protein
MGQINRNTKSLSSNLGFLTNGLSGFIGILSIREVVGFSDEIQRLNSRLVVLTGSQENATKTFGKLRELARDVNQPVSEVAQSFARLSSALQGTGVSQDQIISLTKVLTNSFRLAGSTVQETSSTLVQLSQAFSSGQVRGQELRSVLEQNATLAALLRKEFGQDIYKKAEQGAISAADIFRILAAYVDDVNTKAKNLVPTIGDSLVKALDAFKVQVFELNKTFNLSSNFAKFIDALIDKLPILIGLIGVLAASKIPALIASAVAFAVTLNPVTLSIAAVGAALLLVFDNFEELRTSLLKIDYWILRITAGFLDAGKQLSDFIGKLIGLKNNPISEFFKSASEATEDFAQSIADDVVTKAFTQRSSILLTEAQKNKQAAEELKKAADLLAARRASGQKEAKQRDILAELNIQYNRATISSREYADELSRIEFGRINREFEEGRMNLQAYTQQFEALVQTDLNRSFNDNVISFTEFNRKLEESRLKQLNRDLEQGRISLIEFEQQVVRTSEKFLPGSSLRAGVSGYLQSVGTTSQQVAGAIQNTFTGLENVLSDFIFKGKASFADFTRAILDDLQRIIVRAAIIQPLARGILNFGTGGGPQGGQLPASNPGAGGTLFAAKGAAFDRGLTKFASGGIVNSPTTFGYGNGKRGLMGEAGPEAILPLARTSGGDLGVSASVTPVTINIMNQNGSEVQATEKTGPSGEKSIEVLITNKVRESVANGSLDRVFSQSYGITRKGS